MASAPLRIGIQLPEVEREVRWPELRAIAVAAEEGGFDSVWLGDHLLYRGDGRPERGPWDVWTQLAALAAATSRVRLGRLSPPRPSTLPACWRARPRPWTGLGRPARARDRRRLERGGVPGLRLSVRPPRLALRRDPSRSYGACSPASGSLSPGLSLPSRTPSCFHGATCAAAARRQASASSRSDCGTPTWNIWYAPYGNTADGFAEANEKVTAICGSDAIRARSSAARAFSSPSTAEGASARCRACRDHVAGGPSRRTRGREGGQAILVVDPITERSVRALAALLHQPRPDR